VEVAKSSVSRSGGGSEVARRAGKGTGSALGVRGEPELGPASSSGLGDAVRLGVVERDAAGIDR
jgi:hypothetical protein